MRISSVFRRDGDGVEVDTRPPRGTVVPGVTVPGARDIERITADIDSLRTFNPETQRSTGTVPEIRVLPACKFPLTPTAIERFRGN
jgi:transcription-repair coupling factor (superfamily II helicase)